MMTWNLKRVRELKYLAYAPTGDNIITTEINERISMKMPASYDMKKQL
jgi:hypothetical protein